MYKNVKVNIAIIVGVLVLGGVAFGLSRSQLSVEDQAYTKGMIPHHSIAILTSERANIDDVRVRELADGIIEAQRREIAEMNWLIEENGKAITQDEADQRPVPEFEIRHLATPARFTQGITPIAVKASSTTSSSCAIMIPVKVRLAGALSTVILSVSARTAPRSARYGGRHLKIPCGRLIARKPGYKCTFTWS